MLETEIDFAEGLTGWEELLLGQVLARDVVVDAKPSKRFDILSSLFQDVADDVGPPCFLLVIADDRCLLVRSLGGL